MQLPVDIPAILKEATDIDAALNTPLAVSVLIDETAPGDVVGHVRAAFASAGVRTRVTVGYLQEEPYVPYEGDDMAVVVAGVSEIVGAQAAHLRAAGIPVMVATNMPRAVEEIAEASGFAIPDGDVVAPRARAAGSGVVSRIVAVASGQGGSTPVDEPVLEPVPVEGDTAVSLDVRMGEWIIAACRHKKLAFALAFPFVRRPLSIDAVNATALQNGAVGLLPIIPGADMPIMTLNQAKMLLQIAAAYGQPMSTERVKELACVVGGAFALRNVARSVAGVVPVLGWAVRAGVGYAGTEAMGRAAIEYFEAGGDIVGFATVVQKARDGAAQAAATAAETPTGRKVLAGAKSAAGEVVRRVRSRS